MIRALDPQDGTVYVFQQLTVNRRAPAPVRTVTENKFHSPVIPPEMIHHNLSFTRVTQIDGYRTGREIVRDTLYRFGLTFDRCANIFFSVCIVSL